MNENAFSAIARRFRDWITTAGRGVSLILVCSVLTFPALAGPCGSGNLSALIGTTCDIGSLEFTFTGFTGFQDFVTDGSTTIPGTAWSASDFTFTPTSNGFSLSFADGVGQLLIGPGGGHADNAQDYANLFYNVVALSGDISGENVTGGQFGASGTDFSEGFVTGNTRGASGDASSLEGIEDAFGLNTTFGPTGSCFGSPCTGLSGSPFASGSGSAELFYLEADNSNAVSWDGTPSTFTFTVVPEPRFVFPIAIGFLLIASVAARRREQFKRSRTAGS